MTPGSRRLLTAFLYALIVAAPIAALTPDAQSPTWPAERPTRNHQEGDAVTILFRVTNHQDGVTSYAASNLPPGLSINSATGLVSGTLAQSTPNQLDGSAGTREVTITAANAGGTSPYQFTWRVSRFRKGDVFAGIGGGQYRVFDESGVEKYTIQAETQAEWEGSGAGGGGTTTGCGYNWVSRKMYFTSFDVDHDPHVIEVDPVPAAGGEAFPRNRISTFRDSGHIDDWGTPISIDNAPESVVFDMQGSMYVGHAGGYYDEQWYPADAAGNRLVDDSATYYVDINRQPVLSNGSPVPFPQGYSRPNAQGMSVLEKWPGEPWPGNPLSFVQWGRDIQQFLYNAATGQMTRGGIFDTHASWQGSDWIDLAVDQRTMFYTSEWGVVHRYDVGAVPPDGGRQLDDYATLPPLGQGPHTLYALRILPPGDGTGGVMVAGPLGLLRLSGNRILQSYDAPDADGWFALNISPDGKSVWGASNDTGRIYKFDIASARMLPIGSPASVNGVFAGAVETQPNRYSLDGLCVMGEYTAAQEICGNNVDDDGDGEIDELCQPIEACTGLSPGDDDGDGLVDSNDPDCGAVNICAADGYTDPSVAGYCARHNYEGDSVLLLPAPGPPSHHQVREVYSISGSPSLPPGITFDANAVATGTPLYTTLLNTDVPNTKVYQITVAVRREQISDGSVVSTYQHQFNWTIENRNRPPVAVGHAVIARPGTPVGIEVLGNDSDPDAEDTLTITGNTSPSHGVLSRLGGTFTYTPNAGYFGPDSFTYTIADGHGGTATAAVSITVVNQPPDAVNDAAATIAGFPSAPVAVLANDTDPDNDTLTITAFTQPSSGTVARSADTFVYTPATSFVGVDAFTYTISDGYGGADTATVALTVTNQPPVAIDDAATARATTPVTVPVLANDGDPDGHAITLVSVTPASNGTAAINAGGTITYTANSGFQGIDTFSYTIRDFYGAQDTALVTVTVGPPNRFDPCTCAAAKASPGEIWPPNHKRTEVVNITNVVDPDGGAVAIRILGIYQDEPTNHLGDGETTIDGGGVGESAAWVRAERTGNPNAADNGRVYEIVFEATAADGSHCQGSVFTGVPHDQGQGSAIIDDGIRYDSTVAGGPIVRQALQTERNLSDADVTARGFVPKYVAEARIGGAGAITEMQIGPSLAAPVSTGQFSWTSGEQVRFRLTRTARESTLVLISARQLESVTYRVDCANGECNDLFLRAASTGEGRVTLSSLAVNGRPLPDTLPIPIGGEPRSLRMTGLMADTGVVLTGLVAFEWTSPAPAGRDLNFSVMVGKACPPEGGTGGGGGLGTPPVARDDAYVTDEDTPLTVTAGVLANDLTFGGALGVSIVEATTRGSLTLQPSGTFSYTPEPNFHGLDTFRYKAVDGALESEPTLVTITVNAVADGPIAGGDSASTGENVPVTISVLGNDSDPMGGSLTIQSVTQPANGTAVVSGSGIVYTPAGGFSGVNTFSYTVQGAEGSASALVTVTVRSLNEAPVAVNDAYATAEDTPLTIAAPGVTGNDSDADAGDTIEALLVAQPQHGTLALNASGALTYTPAANYSGPDAFTYRVRDAGGLSSNTATVSLTVTAVNDPPVAVSDSYAVVEDGVLQISAPGVRSNDSDPDTAFASLGVSLATGAQRGSLTLNADGSLIYTPFPNASGADSFTYRLTDGTASSTATVTIVITDVPDPPQAADDAATTPEDTPVTINVIQNDTDSDSATLTLQSVTQAVNGTVAIVSGQARYTPNVNFNGQDVFAYTVTDGQASASAKVAVTVTSVNDLPVASPDSYTTPRRTLLSVQAPGVRLNDSDPDGGQTLSVRVITEPANGRVSLQSNGAFTYDPRNNFSGTDSFTYRINDGVADGNTVSVVIKVGGGSDGNAPPAAADDSYTARRNTALTIPAPGILENDSDPDAGDTITASLVSGPASGTLSLSPDGSFTYTPASNFTGTATFRYRASDGANASSSDATVTIEVRDLSSGTVCYDGGATATGARVTLSWTAAASGDVTIRATASHAYADNTYGINAIGWNQHSFQDLFRSDMARMALYDGGNNRRMEFALDYLAPKSGTASGYGTRGVEGGQQADGGMILGNAADIVAVSTAMDRNFNAFGYVSTAGNHPLKTYSPPTNASYAPNATYPNWIWDVWYEAVVRSSAFGASGFGSARLVDFHASPSKIGVTSWRQVNCQ